MAMVLACAGSSVNKVNGDFGTDINNRLTCKKGDISIMWLLTLYTSSIFFIRDVNTVMPFAVACQLNGSVGRGMSATRN